MPELPEVETIRQYLEKRIINKKILDVEVLNRKSLIGDKRKIINKRISDLDRMGKILIIHLANNISLMIHLKMSGQLIFSKKFKNFSHLRIIFKLDKGFIMFNDLRKFGWIKVLTKDSLEKEFNKLGEDALAIEFDKFKRKCKMSKQIIKLFLMNQDKISGIGNIYANEILFLAKISPFKKACKLKDEEIRYLFRSIKTILKKAIRYGGSSFSLYLKPDQSPGRYQNRFFVYQGEGEKCCRCRGLIRRVKINNRSTFYCPNCQV